MGEKARKEKLEHNLERGNHVGKPGNAELISEFILDELLKGYMIPIHTSNIREIPHAELCHIVIAIQMTIGSDGQPKIKYRPFHDLSYYRKYKENYAVNKRHNKEVMPSIQHRFSLSRFLRALSAMRADNPGRRIMIMKFNADSTFKQIGVSLHSALNKIIVCDKTAFMSTRMTFGGIYSPNSWG